MRSQTVEQLLNCACGSARQQSHAQQLKGVIISSSRQDSQQKVLDEISSRCPASRTSREELSSVRTLCGCGAKL